MSQLDIPVAWTLSAIAAWVALGVGLPINGQIAFALIVQALWLLLAL